MAIEGTIGILRIGGLRAGALTSWRVVTSPTTGKPTLFGAGRFAHFYAGAVGGQAEIALTPTQPTARIGRKPPPKAKPFVLRGRIVELTARQITLAEGEILRG